MTGANQGLGFALIDGLCRALRPNDAVYLTARDEGRGAEAKATLRARGLTPRFARLDVCEPESVERLAAVIKAEHGGVDLVISNASHRIVREVPYAEQVRPFVRTNNPATTRLLEQLGDAVCPGLIDTALSRPWFDDMSKAQTPEAAAWDVVWLATAPRAEVPYGELVQHRKILAWDD